jgi:hypothetical protein
MTSKSFITYSILYKYEIKNCNNDSSTFLIHCELRAFIFKVSLDIQSFLLNQQLLQLVSKASYND